jgi:hypothetical protein
MCRQSVRSSSRVWRSSTQLARARDCTTLYTRPLPNAWPSGAAGGWLRSCPSRVSDNSPVPWRLLRFEGSASAAGWMFGCGAAEPPIPVGHRKMQRSSSPPATRQHHRHTWWQSQPCNPAGALSERWRGTRGRHFGTASITAVIDAKAWNGRTGRCSEMFGIPVVARPWMAMSYCPRPARAWRVRPAPTEYVSPSPKE